MTRRSKYDFHVLKIGGASLRYPAPKGESDATVVRNAASHYFRRIGGKYATQVEATDTDGRCIKVWRTQ